LWGWIRGLPELYKKHLDALKPGILYYFAGYSQEGLPRPFWGKLDYLKSIKNYMFRTEIWGHQEYGWVIYLDSFKENYVHLPEVGRKCDLCLDGERFEFIVGTRGTSRIVYSPGSPDALKKWSNRYFDVDAIATERSHVFEFWNWGINVFMEVIKPKESYSLRPALHFNPRFVRDKALLKDE
jgi:hypothetical protein